MTLSPASSLREANALYERLTELPTLQSASFVDDHSVELNLSYKDHASLQKHTKTGTILLGSDTHHTPFTPRDQSVKHEFPIQTLKKWKISLREEADDKKKRRFVEIWNEQGVRVKCIEVSDAHGSYVGDDVFSTYAATVSGGTAGGRFHILYSASLNLAKHDGENPDPLSRFGFEPPIGEKYKREFRPAVFLLRVGGGKETTLCQLQSERESRIWSSAAFLPSSGHDVTQTVAVAHDPLPNHRRLGEVFCTNRPMSIWRVPLPRDDAKPVQDADRAVRFEKLSEAKIISARDGKSDATEWTEAQQLSSRAYSARCPRVAPTRGEIWSLIWLETPLGGPHSTASHIAFAQGRSTAFTTQPQQMKVQREDQTALSVDKNIGLYVDQLTAQPFLMDPDNGQQLFGLTTIDGSRRRALIFDFTGHERELKYGWDEKDANLSWTFVTGQAEGGDFLLQSSGPAQLPELLLANITRYDSAPTRLYGIKVPSEDSAALDIKSGILRVPGTELKEGESLDRRQIEAILVQPGSKSGHGSSPTRLPCILFPHGGPHSTTTTDWSAALTAMVLSGYSAVLPNYHGSLGRSPFFVDSLIGRCGDLDIADCIKTIDHVIDLGIADRNNVYYQGGSHGGFIGAHLLSRYANRWKAVALRNPVTHIGDMWSDTDIPDWCLAEMDEPYPFDRPPTQLGAERYKKLHTASPLPHVEAAGPETQFPPTLLLVASSDQRVPPSQGLALYHSLRGKQQGSAGGPQQRRTHCCWFEDPDAGHGLESIESARGAWGATWSWFEQWK